MSMTESFEALRCPFCGAASARLLSLFGSQLLLSQYRCAACGSYFEGVRPDRWDSEPTTEAESAPVCDHPQQPVLPATGEDHDGR